MKKTRRKNIANISIFLLDLSSFSNILSDRDAKCITFNFYDAYEASSQAP
jgi:hypothetical protein